METTEHLTHLCTEIERALLGLRDPLEAHVPTCPEWDIYALGEHLGFVWMNMATSIEHGIAEKQPFPDPSNAPPRELVALRTWMSKQSERFVSHAQSLHPTDIRYGWAGPKPVSWFVRRVALETAVHRYDLLSNTSNPEPIDVELADDGIDEYLEIRRARHSPVTPPVTIHLHGTDNDHNCEYLISLDNELTWSRQHAKGNVAVRGTTSDLYLALWGRRGVDQLETFGDESIFRQIVMS